MFQTALTFSPRLAGEMSKPSPSKFEMMKADLGLDGMISCRYHLCTRLLCELFCYSVSFVHVVGPQNFMTLFSFICKTFEVWNNISISGTF